MVVSESSLCSSLSIWACAVGSPWLWSSFSEIHRMSHHFGLCKLLQSLFKPFFHPSLFISWFIFLFVDLSAFSGLLIFTYSPREMSRNHWIRLSTSETSNPDVGRTGSRKGVGETSHRVKNQSKLTQPGAKPALQNTEIFFFSNNELHQSRKVSVH